MSNHSTAALPVILPPGQSHKKNKKESVIKNKKPVPAPSSSSSSSSSSTLVQQLKKQQRRVKGTPKRGIPNRACERIAHSAGAVILSRIKPTKVIRNFKTKRDEKTNEPLEMLDPFTLDRRNMKPIVEEINAFIRGLTGRICRTALHLALTNGRRTVGQKDVNHSLEHHNMPHLSTNLHIRKSATEEEGEEDGTTEATSTEYAEDDDDDEEEEEEEEKEKKKPKPKSNNTNTKNKKKN